MSSQLSDRNEKQGVQRTNFRIFVSLACNQRSNATSFRYNYSHLAVIWTRSFAPASYEFKWSRLTIVVNVDSG